MLVTNDQLSFFKNNICELLQDRVKLRVKNVFEKHNLESWGDIFSNIRLLKDVRLRDFQYKTCTDILSLRSKLFKYKYVECPNCLYCLANNNAVVDDVFHSFWECPVVQETILNFAAAIRFKLGIDLNITKYDVICSSLLRIRNKKVCRVVNEVAIEVKKLLHSPVTIRKVVSYNLILDLIDTRYKIIKKCYLAD